MRFVLPGSPRQRQSLRPPARPSTSIAAERLQLQTCLQQGGLSALSSQGRARAPTSPRPAQTPWPSWRSGHASRLGLPVTSKSIKEAFEAIKAQNHVLQETLTALEGSTGGTGRERLGDNAE